jgi:transposase
MPSKLIPHDLKSKGSPWPSLERTNAESFNRIVWILHTGIPWQDLAAHYRGYQTVWAFSSLEQSRPNRSRAARFGQRLARQGRTQSFRMAASGWPKWAPALA